MQIKWNDVITFISMRGKYPEEARPLVKEYINITRAIMARNDCNAGKEIDEADTENYAQYSDKELTSKLNELFKTIYLRYGHLVYTKPSAEI